MQVRAVGPRREVAVVATRRAERDVHVDTEGHSHGRGYGARAGERAVAYERLRGLHDSRGLLDRDRETVHGACEAERRPLSDRAEHAGRDDGRDGSA